MHVLLTEASSRSEATVVAALEAAGHRVVRCAPREQGLPCGPLHGEPCPLERDNGVDVAVAVRDAGPAGPAATSWGTACVLRAGVPLVVVDAGPGDPLVEFATAVVAIGELDHGVEDAARQGAPVQAAAATTEVDRLLAEARVTGLSRVDLHRRGRDLHVVATVPAATTTATRERIGVHLVGVLRRRDRWSRSIDVAARSRADASLGP